MSAPRKPIFGFLWPSPDPDAPVDAAYRQVRGVRVTPRGPIRVLGLVAATLLTISAMGAMLMAALAMPLSPFTFAGSALVAAALVAVLRGWVVGTYVNDDGVVVETVLRRSAVPWAQVEGLTVRSDGCPFLGTPVRRRATRAFLACRDGRSIATHVYSTSSDLWLRPEAFDMAVLKLGRWVPDQP